MLIHARRQTHLHVTLAFGCSWLSLICFFFSTHSPSTSAYTPFMSGISGLVLPRLNSWFSLHRPACPPPYRFVPAASLVLFSLSFLAFRRSLISLFVPPAATLLLLFKTCAFLLCASSSLVLFRALYLDSVILASRSFRLFDEPPRPASTCREAATCDNGGMACGKNHRDPLERKV